MIRFYFSILFVCLLAVLSLAQSGNLQKVVPPSPNAASLGKYGDTGSANIGSVLPPKGVKKLKDVNTRILSYFFNQFTLFY